MKFLNTVLFACLALSALATTRIVMPSLPEATTADAEVATNFPLSVNTARLEKLTIAFSLDSCVTNEVLVALGAGDCGAWYRADLRMGETTAMTTNTLVIGKLEFDPLWNLAKVVRRGFGEIGESVSVDEERVRFDIRIR